jgi:hypothetical protein
MAVNAVYSVVLVSTEVLAEDVKVGCRYDGKYKISVTICDKT